MKFGMVWRRSLLRHGIISFLLLVGLLSSVAGQGFTQTPYAQSSIGTRSALNLAPSNPLGMPGSTGGLPRGSDSIFLSPALFYGILPPIPNLEIGYLYNFGNRVRSSRFTLDYVLPVALSNDSVVFGEAHSEWHNFWKTLRGLALGLNSNPDSPNSPDERFDTRADVSLGGGYRRLVNRNTLIGVNGFYDTTWLGGRWYSSGGVGCELAMPVAGNDAVDLNFNWYGNLLSGTTLRNAFRYGPSNYDLEVGYSHELWDKGPDLRLKATGYKFSVGSTWTDELVRTEGLAGPIYGWNFGAELRSRNGAFTVKYETGHDRANATYHTVGGFVTVGLEIQNLLNGENPFVMPEPIFNSPRNLRRWLTGKVRRNWHQLASVVQTGSPAVYFVIDFEDQEEDGWTSPIPISGSTAELHMDNGDEVQYRRYSINFAGDIGELPEIVPVTITWERYFCAASFRWGSSGNNNGSETVNVPRSGGTIGSNGTIINVSYRPWVYPGCSGVLGTVTFSAPGVTTLTVQVIAD